MKIDEIIREGKTLEEQPSQEKVQNPDFDEEED